MLNYEITARDWDEELSDRFGERGSFHELSDAEVVESIIDFGRAQIVRANDGHYIIDFQNQYD